MAGSISTLGVGSGLQLQDIIDQLREVDQGVIDRKQDDITVLESQLEEFTSVKNKLLELKSSALDLSLSSTFLGRSVTSSDEKVLGATVIEGATAKTSSIEVTNLAEQSTWMSSTGLAGKDSSVTDESQTISFQIGDKTTSLSIAAGTTLTQLVDKINNDTENPGVTASIIDDGLDAEKPYKLVLQAKETGEENRVNFLVQIPGLVMTEKVDQLAAGSLNAKLTVNGIDYHRQTNSINDIISGVTLNLYSEGTSTITVGNNDDALKETITGLVGSFGELVLDLKASTGYDPDTEEFGVLNGTTLRSMPYDLGTLMSTLNKADSSGSVGSLFDLGMEIDRNGIITISESKLEKAIKDYPEEIAAFFLGDSDKGITGFADTVNDRLRSLTSAAGIVEAERTAAQIRISDIELQIEEDSARLDKKYDQLAQQFVALDSFMNEMTSMSNFLSGQFDSLSKGWNSSSSSGN